LAKHGKDGSAKHHKPAPPPEEATSVFQELFTQRAQGFHIDFRFRNAPPRPPVGPCFVGSGLDGVLLESSQYKPLNAVEVSYRWKLHSEPDLGVPLAPSAIDAKSYNPSTSEARMHPDDEALLNWHGSFGDTAAEELKKRRDHARAAARLALMGKSPAKLLERAKPAVTAASSAKKHTFSRVLEEDMKSWMKKTTYLSNDYTRKVHDFRSLAKTKQDLEKDLEVKQQGIVKQRSPMVVANTFLQNKAPVRKHPTKKNLQPVREMALLPNTDHWGYSYTHVVMDKTPGDEDKLDRAFIANVEKRDANARMTCQLFVPASSDNFSQYQAIQEYELDVIPLKEEDAPHTNFSIWIDPDGDQQATYLPISSRVMLSTGRPLKKKNYNMIVTRRAMNAEDVREMEDRLAEVDADAEERVAGGGDQPKTGGASKMQIDSDEDDDDSDHGDSFVATKRTIVAD
jgi:Paf1